MRSIHSSDGKHLAFADGFGLTRVSLPNKVKTERKSSAGLAATLSLNAAAADEGKVKALLKQADDYRLALESGRVETEVRSFKAGVLDKTRLYAVYLKPGRRSLVLFRTASERGQKMLMLGDDYWLMMPSSQRPLRITPMQKLLGEASTGDIATMTWGEDYDGTISGEEVIDGGGRRFIYEPVR